MLKKLIVLMFVLMLTLSFAACANDDNNGGTTKESLSEVSGTADSGNEAATEAGDTTTDAQPQGDLVPSFTVDWPADMLPEGFPNLGKVTKVNDSRMFGKTVTVIWNIVNEDQVKEIIDKLNVYLDYDHAWQDYFYSDGLKYKPGTQDESIRVVVRYSPTASGELEPGFNPQFYLEISGEGLPASE